MIGIKEGDVVLLYPVAACSETNYTIVEVMKKHFKGPVKVKKVLPFSFTIFDCDYTFDRNWVATIATNKIKKIIEGDK